jgi:hypothetical protein
MIRGLIILSILLSANRLLGQSFYGQSWITGGGNSYKVKFSGTQKEIKVYDTNYNFYFHLGSSCISDSSGNLKIVCDGYNLMDSLGSKIDNGDTLVPKELYIREYGWSAYSQSSIILPFSDDIYYVITPTASDYEVVTYWNNPGSGRALFDLLLYHKVDMKLNGGAGKVVKKAVPLLENVKLSKTQMMACRHANGVDWWLLKQAHDTNMVYRFLVTKDSIYNKGVQGFAEPHFTKWDVVGQSMFSQDGTKYATVCVGLNQLFLADFDRCTGQLNHPKVINIGNHQIQPLDTSQDISPKGVCFSSNGQFLYIVKYFNIFQYELSEPDSALAWYHVANLDTTWGAQFQRWSCAYLGPDNKVYIGNWGGLGKAMSVIDNPNVKGVGCGFCPKCFQFPKIGVNTPPCMPNYALGADLPCWPLSLPSPPKEGANALEVYPNPASSKLEVRYEIRDVSASEDKRNANIEMYNTIGQRVYSSTISNLTSHVCIDVSRFAKGVYYLKCGIFTKKIIIE